MTISNNVSAPEFNLADQHGKMHSLADYYGKTVLLYFYPKDDTPGCTTEACSFRDDYSQYEKSGVVILGVSPDSVKSHAKFAEKYHLQFPLLADEGHAICDKYGVWGLKKMMGREYYGVFRTTFMIGPDGMIRKVYEGVKPAEHSAEILKDMTIASV
jgi:thioredoxin-dependent peroxiredoxin